jgi:GNAT superfamily N-acetyltransferase
MKACKPLSEDPEHFSKLEKKDQILVTRLTSDYIFKKSFDCGNPDLNDFLLNDSIPHLRHLNYITYLIETDKYLIAYFSLANDILHISNMEDFREDVQNAKIDVKYEELFFDQRNYPAVKLGRLAVDKKFQSQGVGNYILDSIKYSFMKDNKAGCQFITIDALNNPRVTNFYEREGFCFLTLYDVNKPSRVMFKCLLDDIEDFTVQKR